MLRIELYALLSINLIVYSNEIKNVVIGFFDRSILRYQSPRESKRGVIYY
jgi:hypothetical protein